MPTVAAPALYGDALVALLLPIKGADYVELKRAPPEGTRRCNPDFGHPTVREEEP